MTSMKINHFSRALSFNMDCRVLMPDNIGEGEKLKVIWLCHGGSGDESEWLNHSTIAEIVEKARVAFVINNANDSCFVDMAYGGKYGQYIGEELPQIIWSMFKCLSDKREDNYICGLSNGGYGAFIIGFKYRMKFCAIGALSAGDKADAKPKPLDGGKMNPRIRMFGQEDISETEYSIKYLVKKAVGEYKQQQDLTPLPQVYHACGGEDPWLDMNHLVRDCIQELSCDELNYVYHEIEGIGHEWRFWDIEVRNFLDYVGIGYC